MIEWIVTSSVLIAVVILIRFVFQKRLSLRVRYALWLAVALRLLVPVTISESPFSVLNLLPERSLSEESRGNENLPEAGMGNPVTSMAFQGMDWTAAAGNTAPGVDAGAPNSNVISGDAQVPVVEGREPEQRVSVGESIFSLTRQDAGQILLYAWLAGVLISGAFILAVNISYGRRLCRSRISFTGELTEYLTGDLAERLQGKQNSLTVYVSEAVRTPCLFGLLRPAIYLTPRAVEDPESLHYILCHESVHYRHRDHFWSLVRTICLCLHWYNPFVWLASSLSRQDGELACDEETVQWLGEPKRLDYGMALLEFCAKGRTPFHSITLATTMSGGKRKLRERLELIAKQPKKTAGALAAVALLVILLLAVTFTGRRVEQADPLMANAANQGIGNGEDLEGSVSNSDAGDSSFDGNLSDADADDLPPEDSVLSVPQALQAVLLNEMPLIYFNDNTPYRSSRSFYQYEGYLEDLMNEILPYETPRFAIVDMDGDTIPEVLLELSNYMGYVILRYREGRVYAFYASYRAMSDLKPDGSFLSFGSAFDAELSKIFYIGDTHLYYFWAEWYETYDLIDYYNMDMVVDEETWERLFARFKETPDLEWYDFTEESISQWIVDNPMFAEKSPETMAVIKERQDLVDSLSYLLEMTFNGYEKEQEESCTDSKNYYESCTLEMEKIYQLCAERLSGSQLEELEAGQQRWQENFDLRLAKELGSHRSIEELDYPKITYTYYEYGDMILRRIFALINVYYDNEFYVMEET